VSVTLVGKNKRPPGKIKGDIYRFDVAESKYGNQNDLSPTTFKGERFKFKTMLFNKQVNKFLKLLYTVQNVKIVPEYNILPKNK
jgi:hypothetical protein